MAGYRLGNKISIGSGNTISGANDYKTMVAMGTWNTIASGTTDVFIGGSGNTIASGASECMVFGRSNTLSGSDGPVGTWVGGKDNTVDSAYSLVHGRNNTLPSGSDAVAILGARNCTVSSGMDYGLITGYGHEVSGAYCLVAGDTNTIGDGDNSAMFGYENTALLSTVIIGGHENTAGVTGENPRGASSMATGVGGVARFHGGHTMGGGKFTTVGDAQTTRAILKVQTTDATVTTMLCGDTTTHLPILANDSAVIFKASIIARQTDADDVCGAWTLLGALDRNATAGTTLLLGSVTKTLIHRDVGTWDVDATADAVNGSLDIKVTGEVGDAVNWVCALDFTEVVG